MCRLAFKHLGIYKFDKEYTHTNSLYYFLTSLLKNTNTSSQILSQKTGLSLKSCQRYIYNKNLNNFNAVNLEHVNLILNYLNMSYSDIFFKIEEFIKHKYIYVIFKDNNIEMFHDSYYQENNIKDLIRLLKLRNNLLIDYKLHEYSDELEKQLSVYPNQLIIDTYNSIKSFNFV